jgi:hypothetical protein
MKHVGAALLLLSLVMGPMDSQSKEFDPNNPLNPPAPIYWCPDRTADRLITTTPDPGCSPLVDPEDENKTRKKEEPAKDPIKIVEIQNEASKFVQRYRQFLDCCASKIESIEDVEELHDQASYILKSVQQKGIYNSTGFGKGDGASTAGPGDGTGNGGLQGGAGKSPKLGTFARQYTLGAIVGTVARARDDLRQLKTRLEQLAESKQKVDTLDYEIAGRERRKIEEEEEAIAREFRAKRPPASARTGMEIQNTTIPTRIGGDIESTTLGSSFGADINRTVSPYSDVREDLHPRRGLNIQDTNLPTRSGPALGGGNTPPSDLPTSTGFEIGTTQGPTGPSTNPARVGPSIGDSTLNNR